MSDDKIPMGSERDVSARERLLGVFTGALAALCDIPVSQDSRLGKEKVSLYVSEMFISEKGALFESFITGLQRSNCALSSLKVLYSCCHVSVDMCHRLARDSHALQSVISLLEGRVCLSDVSQMQTAELSLFLMSLLVLRLQSVPEPLSHVALSLPDLLIECDAPSFVAAAALLTSALRDSGEPVTLSHERLLAATRNALVDTPQ
ncbi:serine/threonine-protein kinase 36-like, partial [Ascaphus truei]|uniref:serine/threonine-protein kinase 36-like n=1 Tax=Ascaphus truei TaxID=8439 RepID=UPI003F597E4C